MVLPELKVLKFYRCYILRRVFIAQFQGLEDFSFILSLSLQGLNIHFDGKGWGGSRSDMTEEWGLWVWKYLWCECSEGKEWVGCVGWHYDPAFGI